MDINLLIINVGNTRTAFGIFSAGVLEQVTRIPHADQKNWRAVVESSWQNISGRPFATVVGASVNPIAAEPLEKVVEEVTGEQVQWVGREIELPMNVLTTAPGETGPDRLMNMAAAFEQMEHACVVVDAGTAITIDICNDNGDFLGGAIAPGVAMMLQALHQQTARLPQVPFEAPSGPWGKSTREAILHGVYHGIRGMVKELVENYATALGRWPEIIATGGDAKALFAEWELIHAVSPDLTLYGIALAYTNHQIRHQEL